MKKSKIAMIALSVYAVATTAFIAADSWTDFQRDYVQTAANQAFQAGQQGAVKQLLAEAGKCKPIEVFAGDQKVQLMNMSCANTEEPLAQATISQ